MKKEYARAGTILFITLFLVMVGFGIVIPIIPFFIENLGGGAVALGLFTASYSLMQFFFAPYWGRLSDRIGRRPVLLIGLLGFGVTFILFGFSTAMWQIFVIRILSGIVSSATLPTAMAYIADITEGTERSKAIGKLGAAMSVGMIFGPALGGWLGHFSFALPFFIAGGFALLVLPFAYLLLPESLTKKVAIGAKQQQNLDFQRIIQHPLMLLFMVNFVINFTMAMFQGTFAFFAAARVGLGPKEMGTLFAFLGIIGVVIQGGVIGRLVKFFGDANLIKAGVLISAIGMLLMLLAPNLILLYLATAVFQVGNFIMGPSSSSLVTQNSTGGQGASLGLFQSFGSLGRILGPVVGGLLYDINMLIPYAIGAISMMLLILVAGNRLGRYQPAKA